MINDRNENTNRLITTCEYIEWDQPGEHIILNDSERKGIDWSDGVEDWREKVNPSIEIIWKSKKNPVESNRSFLGRKWSFEL